MTRGVPGSTPFHDEHAIVIPETAATLFRHGRTDGAMQLQALLKPAYGAGTIDRAETGVAAQRHRAAGRAQALVVRAAEILELVVNARALLEEAVMVFVSPACETHRQVHPRRKPSQIFQEGGFLSSGREAGSNGPIQRDDARERIPAIGVEPFEQRPGQLRFLAGEAVFSNPEQMCAQHPSAHVPPFENFVWWLGLCGGGAHSQSVVHVRVCGGLPSGVKLW